MTAIEKVLKFCDDIMIYCRETPAANDYQLGYEAAIEQVMEFATTAKDEDDDRVKETQEPL